MLSKSRTSIMKCSLSNKAAAKPWNSSSNALKDSSFKKTIFNMELKNVRVCRVDCRVRCSHNKQCSTEILIQPVFYWFQIALDYQATVGKQKKDKPWTNTCCLLHKPCSRSVLGRNIQVPENGDCSHWWTVVEWDFEKMYPQGFCLAASRQIWKFFGRFREAAWRS